MPPPPSEFERQQLDVIARVTPHAMLGHILNTTVLAAAVAASIPTVHLIVWCAYSYAVALLLLYRHARSRGRAPRSFRRAALRARLYGLLLALPWSSMAVLHLGGLGHDQELVLVAIGVGMAASGTVLLSAVPLAAFSYMSAILLPAAVKCLFLVNQGGYVFLGALAVSYWWFLSALIAKVSREIGERKQADLALKDSEVRLQEALDAGQVVAFTWDPASGLSQRSANAPRVLGLPSHAGPDWGPGSFLERVHADDRACFAAQVKALSPEKPSYSAAFRFIRPEGQEVWLEETGKAEFDGDRRYLRLRGLTRDITESKRAEERQRQLVHELDHRVKNVLASVAAVAQRTSEASPSMVEFVRGFDGRVQAMANAHALLSRSRWQGAQLADLVLKELAPWAGKGNTSVEGAGCAAVPGRHPAIRRRLARARHQRLEIRGADDAAWPHRRALEPATAGRGRRPGAGLGRDRGAQGQRSGRGRLRHRGHPQPHSLRAWRQGRSRLRRRRRALPHCAAVEQGPGRD